MTTLQPVADGEVVAVLNQAIESKARQIGTANVALLVGDPAIPVTQPTLRALNDAGFVVTRRVWPVSVWWGALFDGTRGLHSPAGAVLVYLHAADTRGVPWPADPNADNVEEDVTIDFTADADGRYMLRGPDGQAIRTLNASDLKIHGYEFDEVTPA